MSSSVQLSAVTLLFSTLLPQAFAGGGEVYCSGGNEIEEAWRNVAATGLEWEIHGGAGPAAVRIGPNFYPIGLFNPASPLDAKPGLQSMHRAAEAWSQASVGGINIADIEFGNPTYFSDTAPPAAGIPAPKLFSFTSGFPVRVLDGVNTVTLWEPSTTFVNTGIGGAGVVAVTLVEIDVATGDILEADIAMNARMQAGSSFSAPPYWSFVEFNAFDQRWYASTTEDAGFVSSLAGPASGYVDLEGVLAHEFGHFLGVAHSLVDGRWSPNTGTTPTMFITGHTTSPFDELASFYNGSAPPIQLQMDASTTTVGGLLADTAKTLEQDDLSALASAYPRPVIVQSLGGLQGTVTDANGNPVLGAHVVAFRADSPDIVRAGALTRAGGAYQIPRLPAGDYYVYVEPVDTNLFEDAILPSYVFPGSLQCASPSFFQTEFWDTAESANEADPMRANIVPVIGGPMFGTTRDFIVVSESDRLQVQLQGSSTQASSRGLLVAPAPGTTPTVRFDLDFAPGISTRPAFLAIGFNRRSLILDSQLVVPANGGAAPTIVNLALNNQGDVSVSFPIGNALAHNAFFVQAIATSPNGSFPLQVSNPVTVYVEQP